MGAYGAGSDKGLGVSIHCMPFVGKLAGEDIGLSVLRAWAVGESEFEPPQDQGPASLARVEVFGSLDIS